MIDKLIARACGSRSGRGCRRETDDLVLFDGGYQKQDGKCVRLVE